MNNFTKSEFEFMGVTYYRYAANRKRGGSEYVFFNSVPYGKVYDPTWPKYIESSTSFIGSKFYSRMKGDDMYVDFLSEITTQQESDLDGLYDSHVAPTDPV